MINKELLNQVRDHIVMYPEQFDMDNWYLEKSCGTTACIAGWALFLQGQDVDQIMKEGLIEEAAMAALNIDDYRLFFVHNWPTKHKIIAIYEGEVKGAVTLIDDLINDIDVWNEDEN